MCECEGVSVIKGACVCEGVRVCVVRVCVVISDIY